MINQTDRDRIRAIFDPATYSRGAAYALAGHVVERIETANGLHAVGKVTGTAAKPYVVDVQVIRSPEGHLVDVSSTCSCPMRGDCKHVVALLLAAAPKATSAGLTGSSETTTEQVPWEDSVARLLETGGGVPATTQLGLEFSVELTGRPGVRTGPGIAVRPMQLSPTGAWTSKGISWYSVDEAFRRFSGNPVAAEPYRILRELRALSQASAAYSAAADEVALEQVSSSGLWSLLHDAAQAGIGLVATTKPPSLVAVEHDAAVISLDLTRRGTSIHAEPRAEHRGQRIAIERSILIGNPAHGIAWWDLTGPSASLANLHVAPLRTPIDEQVRNFLRTATFDVPAEQTKQFLAGPLVQLARRVFVSSSDGSVDVPVSGAPVLVLQVEQVAGQALRCAWFRGVEGSSFAEPLFETPLYQLPRDERAALDAATACCGAMPVLLESLGAPRLRQQVEVAGMDAVTLMVDVVPKLEQVPGVRVDVLGEVPNYRPAVDAPVVTIEATGADDGDWFNLGVTVTVGGEQVPFVDLFTALATGEPTLILPSGTYFSLETPEFAALAKLIEESRALNPKAKHTISVGRYQAEELADLVNLGLVAGQAEAWYRSIEQLAAVETLPPVALPSALDATLRPYQAQGFTWLAHLYDHGLGGVLGDDMGLGKTIQALALMLHAREANPDLGPFLVVAPTSVVGNWAREAAKFAPGLTVVTVHETGARRGTTIAEIAASADLVVTSYALFRLEAEEYDVAHFAGAFFDEAQFLKNRVSKGWRCAKALDAPFKVAMSGTPIENNLTELWSLLSIASPGLFPSSERFGDYYRTPIEKRRDADRLAQLKSRVKPFLLRRTKEEVADDLPEKQEQVVEVELAPAHRRRYDAYLHRQRQELLGMLDDFTARRFEILRAITQLRLAALDVGLIDEESEHIVATKLDVLVDMLDEIVGEGHRVLVFSQFTSFLTKAKDRADAAGYASCYLDGATTRRSEVIAEFQDGDAPIFFISLKAGGVGINLTEADYCILLDPWWNPAVEDQAVSRAHRIGQTRKVNVYRLVAKDTIEEKVMALKAKKQALFADVFGDEQAEFASASISAEDIRALLD